MRISATEMNDHSPLAVRTSGDGLQNERSKSIGVSRAFVFNIDVVSTADVIVVNVQCLLCSRSEANSPQIGERGDHADQSDVCV